VQVTDEPIVKVVHQSGTVYWLTAKAFGLVQMSTLDGMYYPCRGWGSKAVDLHIEHTSTNKVYVVLEDGDVLMYHSEKKKGGLKACDLQGKFPRIFYSAPQLHVGSAHGYALQGGRAYSLFISEANAKVQGTYTTDATHLLVPKAGGAMTDAQGSFTLLGGSAGLSFVRTTKGKARRASAAAKAESGESENGWLLDLLERVPNSLLFGIAIIGAVMWNVRKVNQKRKEQDEGVDEEEWKASFAKKLQERRAMAKQGAGGGGGGGAGGAAGALGALGGGEGLAGKLSAKDQEGMRELMESMRKLKADAAALKGGGAGAE